MKYNDFSAIDDQSLYNIVSDMSDNTLHNLKEYLKIVLKQPGLKLDGNNFACSMPDENTVQVNVGPAVFDNYEIFVPQGSSSAELRLSKDYDIVFIYLIRLEASEARESFPINRAPEQDGVNIKAQPVPAIDYAYEHSTVKLIASASPIESEDAIIIATAELDDEDTWHLVSNTQANRLRMIQNYPIQDWSPTSAQITAVRNVVLQTFNLANMKRSSYTINGVEADINSESSANNLHQASIISVSWDAPSTAELALLGPVIYYKVILSPTLSDVDDWQIDHTILYDGTADRTFCNIPCATGVTYDVDVVRVSDLANGGTVSPVYNIGSVTGGWTETVSTSASIQNTVNVEQAFGAGAVYWMKPEFSLETDQEHYVQLFVQEYKDEDQVATPIKPTGSDLCRPQYLYYSGHAQKQLFAAHPDTVALYVCARLIGPGEQVIATTPVIECNIFEASSQFVAWTWPIPNLGVGGANDIFLYTFSPEKSFIIRRLIISGRGLTTQAGYIDIYADNMDDDQYLYYDSSGNGDSEEDTSNVGPDAVTFAAGNNVHIWAHGDGGVTNPSGCIITMLVELIE